MDIRRPAFRRTRQIRETTSWISTMTHFERNIRPVTVIKDYQSVQNSYFVFPGVQQISNPNAPFAIRMIWLFVILASTTVLFIQSFERITYYFSEPSRVNAYIPQNNTIKLPLVTMCPYPGIFDDFIPLMNRRSIVEKFNSYSMHPENVFELFAKGNISLSEMWSLSKLRMSNVSLRNQASNEEMTKMHKESLSVKAVSTPIGICNEIKFDSEIKRVSERPLFVVDVDKDAGGLIMVSLTTPEDSPMDRYLYHLRGIPAIGWYGIKYVARITESVFRNTSKNPCFNEDASECLARCFENIFLPKTARKHCRLPFMQHSNEVSPCHSKVELDEMIAATTTAARKFNPAQCNCRRLCRQILYTADYTQHAQAKVWAIELIVPDGRITLLKEESAYSGYDLFADLGGSLSLWLGLCFLQVLEFTTFIFTKFLLKSGFKKNKQEQCHKIGRRFRIVVVRNDVIDTEKAPSVELPGFRNVLYHDSKFWIRALWLAVSLAALLVNFQQCMERIALYFSDPSTVNVYYKSFTSLPFPSIMVCPSRRDGLIPALPEVLLNKKPVDQFAHQDALQLATQGQLTAEDSWNISGFTFEYLGTSSSVHKDWISSTVPTIFGNCHTFQLNKTVSNKGISSVPPLHLVNFTIGRAEKLRVMMFLNEDLDLVKYLGHTDFVEFEMHASLRLDTAFRVTQLSYRWVQRNPCVEREQVVRCLRECVEKNIFINVPQGNCRLPFMATNTSVCNTTKSMATVLKAAFYVIDTFSREDCVCVKACKEYLYTKEYSKTNPHSTSNEVIVQTQFWNNEIMVIEELSGYNAFALFSDIGGLLGLISGMCIINLFEIAEMLFSKLIIFLTSKYRSKKQKRSVAPQVYHRRIIITDDLSGGLENENKDKTELSYAGIKGNNSRLRKQIVWLLISLVLLHPCIYLSLDRIQYLSSDPTSSTTYYSRNDTITFPIMVICPEIDQSLYSTLVEELKFEEYWNISIFPLKSIIIKVNGLLIDVLQLSSGNNGKLTEIVWQDNNTASDKVFFSKVMTAAGICIMIEPKQPVLYSGYVTQITTSVWFKKQRDSHKSFVNTWMAVFPVEKLPFVKYLNSKDCYFGRDRYKTYGVDISMQVSEFIHRNTREVPCEHSPIAVSCLTNCFEKQISSKHGLNCRLPFMPETQNHKMCKTMEEYLEIKNATRDLYEHFNQTDCNCARQCRVVTYSVDELVIKSHGSYEHEDFNLRIPDNSFLKSQEDAAYSFIKLLSDLGGSIGLFFGLGFLQILATLADLMAKLNTCRTKCNTFGFV